MRTKKERAVVIRKLFDTLRKEIVVESEIHLKRLEMLEDWENRAIKENSDKALNEVIKFTREKKKKIYKLKSIGKKYIVENGKIVGIFDL